MATNPFNTPRLKTDLFSIFNDNASVAQIAMPLLPSGACNFVNLTSGSAASKCGCRRFWARPAQGIPLMDQDQSLYCMCEHHACYHDQGARDPQQSAPVVATSAPDNGKPSTGRDPLSPLFHLDINMDPSATPKVDPAAWSGVDHLSFLQQSLDGAVVNIADASPRPVASMPDTLAWADMIQTHPDANTTMSLPPIPPQCLMQSQATSTTSSVRAKYMRPFAGKGLHTLKAAPTVKHTPPESQVKPYDPVPVQQSKMPAVLGESFFLVAPEADDPARPGTATTQIEPRANPEHFSREDVRNLTDIINSHAQRLDKIETISFTAENHEECFDRHEHLDLRITDLESRMEETERMAQDSANSRQEDDASTVSGSTSRASYSVDVYSKLQSLQAQVSHLQSYIPSPTHAWGVEVVFLPFPLQRVWQYSHQFTDPATSHEGDWTQMSMTHSTSTLHQFTESQSAFWGTSPMRDLDLEWLLPRAFGDTSVTDKRLRSRGLVQRISINSPDAGAVQLAITNAFGSVFRNMQMYRRSFESNSRISRFMGLQSSWVPLRKLHKDSRLRFLSPDEMLNPMLWNVEFLNSIMMKTSQPRLFITHPDAYVQDRHAYETGWSWQKLKEITSPCPDYTESQQAPEMEEHDECWNWNEQLDDAPKAQMPVAQRQERRRVSISPSVAYFPAEMSRRSTSPLMTRDQLSKLHNQGDPRAPYVRTASLPPSTAAQESPSIINPKSRVASSGRSRRTTPVHATPLIQGGGRISKRRQTRSPSRAHFTPRRTASPSPMPLGLQERQAARSTTPYNYATPYSIAPLQELRLVRGGSVVRQSREDSDLDLGDEDDDMQIYESGSDMSLTDMATEDDETSAAHKPAVPIAQPDHHRQPGSSSFRIAENEPEHEPEHEPWAGCESDGGRSDGENNDALHIEQDIDQENEKENKQHSDQENEENIDRDKDQDIDLDSDTSSEPSEYPTSQSAWHGEAGDESSAFHIHEDVDNNE